MTDTRRSKRHFPPLPLPGGTSWKAAGALILLSLLPCLPAAAQEAKDKYLLPPAPIADYINRDKNFTTLDQMSPDGDHFYIASATELSSLELMSQRILRLAQLKITPETNREHDYSTYGVFGLRIYSLKDRTSRTVSMPAGTIFSDMTWSPDGRRLAFLANLPKGSQVWVADAASGAAQPVSEAFVMATLAKRPEPGRGDSSPLRLIQWTPDGSILTLLVPSDRGPEPQDNPIPSSPIIRRTLPKPAPTVTQPFLLRTEHDRALFRYYTTAQLALLTPGQPPRKVGRPAMYQGVSLSPDGKYVFADKIVEPLSYLVAYNQFAHDQEIMDLDGRVLATVCKVPLNEGLARDGAGGDGFGADLPRDIQWRPDGKGLSFLWLEPRKKEEAEAAEPRDRIMFLPPPFDMSAARTLVASAARISAVSYAPDGKYAFATLTERPRTAGARRRQEIVAYDLSQAQPRALALTGSYDPDDIVRLPGSVMTRADGNGIVSAVISTDGRRAYLEGAGYKPDFKPRPFIDAVTIETGEKQRLFEGSAEQYERPRAALDNDLARMIVTREGKNTFPDSYLWTRGGQWENLTHNRDPYPDITAARRIDFDFKRSDGVTVYARITLPLDYKEGTRVPAVFWDYPREYPGAEEYTREAIRARNRNAHTPLSFLRWSDLWITQGYALVYTDIPILGKGNQFNDFYVTHLLDSVYGAIRKLDQMGLIDVDRLGHGGHSYGAFTTANLLAHSPFFKAGIAGDGAYNRTLTPMTFQSERRFFWEAQTTYTRMSPFFYADQINAPLLLYHGAEDDNSGTFVIQSQRMMQALTGLGKKAVLYVYPFEAHSPRCRETYLDIWARWIEWFDTYVKNAGRKDAR